MSLFQNPDQIEAMFTRKDGSYAFARWGRPIAPIVFGVDDATLKTVKGAVEAVVTLAGHHMAETDPELGSNLMFFFFREWSELLLVPDLDRMIPNLQPLVTRLNAADAAHYRAFRFDENNAIQAAFVFVRVSGAAAEQAAEDLALSQVVQVILMWGDQAFAEKSPLALVPGQDTAVLRPEIAGIIAAAYDRMMPQSAADPSHALRLFARLQAPIAQPDA
jgi:hypothetical protein